MKLSVESYYFESERKQSDICRYIQDIYIYIYIFKIYWYIQENDCTSANIKNNTYIYIM